MAPAADHADQLGHLLAVEWVDAAGRAHLGLERGVGALHGPVGRGAGVEHLLPAAPVVVAAGRRALHGEDRALRGLAADLLRGALDPLGQDVAEAPPVTDHLQQLVGALDVAPGEPEAHLLLGEVALLHALHHPAADPPELVDVHAGAVDAGVEPRDRVLVGIVGLIRGDGRDDRPSGCAVVTPLDAKTGFVRRRVGPPDVEVQPEPKAVEPVIRCDVQRRGRRCRGQHARNLIGIVRDAAVLQRMADAWQLRNDEAAAERDVDARLRQRDAHAVVHHAHQVRRAAEAPHAVLGDVDGVDALDVARGAAREGAVAGGDLQKDAVQVEPGTKLLQLALGIALAARQAIGAEAQRRRR